VTEDWTLYEDRRRASSFGDDPEQYDRVRPPYPRALIDTLVAEHPRDVLDVGCGTGIVARLLLSQGCDVLGLEPDPRMAEVARRHGVTVEAGTIEDWDAAGRRFDLLTAGQAWHWVDPRRGAAKAAQVLRPGGRIGLFWNQAHPDISVRPALEAAYSRHAPELGASSVLLGRRETSLYEGVAETLRQTGAFGPVTVQTFEHEIVYSSQQWLDLATTHSDHHTLPPERLALLLADVRREVDQVGGQVPVRYEATLVTGLRRD
jgi:SAM-dependent methyltransferase